MTRINLKFCLTSFSRQETQDYIHNHLQLAGRKDPIFNQGAIDAIHRSSSAIPRIINTLAVKCLSLEALEKKEGLTEENVYSAYKDL